MNSLPPSHGGQSILPRLLGGQSAVVLTVQRDGNVRHLIAAAPRHHQYGPEFTRSDRFRKHCRAPAIFIHYRSLASVFQLVDFDLRHSDSTLTNIVRAAPEKTAEKGGLPLGGPNEKRICGPLPLPFRLCGIVMNLDPDSMAPVRRQVNSVQRHKNVSHYQAFGSRQGCSVGLDIVELGSINCPLCSSKPGIDRIVNRELGRYAKQLDAPAVWPGASDFDVNRVTVARGVVTGNHVHLESSVAAADHRPCANFYGLPFHRKPPLRKPVNKFDLTPLILPLKASYFNEIREGTKPEEFRLVTPYWIRRLVGKEFSHIEFTLGYPARSNAERRLIRPWRGMRIATITHPHFGTDPVEVFAIRAN
ncbi:hypothetical protein [Roseateles terrae]|uniref:Uncharacterized protein n=1 Tax=Roseateles terrae TaxID=431060 RepID=A0ABR6GPD6_9BURK|nr:hypothetical protein [Roseateles terrae]MBB3193986.1 hypothetical protein [Roseateles terrae]